VAAPTDATSSWSEPAAAALFVQAASFVSYENAQRAQAMLSRVGNARISQSVVGGTRYYRVQVGPLASWDEADRTLAQVVASGLADARILQD
jgi:rare lipoprotein A